MVAPPTTTSPSLGSHTWGLLPDLTSQTKPDQHIRAQGPCQELRHSVKSVAKPCCAWAQGG